MKNYNMDKISRNIFILLTNNFKHFKRSPLFANNRYANKRYENYNYLLTKEVSLRNPIKLYCLIFLILIIF